MAKPRDPFTPEEFRSAWATMAFRDRRRILKSTNRGRPVDDPRDARLGVGAARMQKRFWRWVWVIGPLLSLFQLGRGRDEFLANLILATVMVGGMAYWFHRRARLAEAANLELLAAGGTRPSAKRPDPASDGASKSEGTGRLRRGRRRAPEDDEPASETAPRPSSGHLPTKRPPPIEHHEDFRPDPNTSRKKAKRRKR